MDKEALRDILVKKLEADLKISMNAATDAHATATHEETQAKSKYDTFALEASYLAQGQAKRVQELEQAVEFYKTLTLNRFSDDSSIALTALISLEKEDGTTTTVFLGPAGGGMKVLLDEESITVVTPQSPMGRSLIGKCLGDVIEVRTGELVVEYEVVGIL